MPNIVRFICVALLLGALAPLPYGYYTLLRIVATGTFAWAAIVSAQGSAKAFVWVFAILTLIFNPIIPIHLPKALWAFIDVGSAILLLATGRVLAPRDDIRSEKERDSWY